MVKYTIIKFFGNNTGSIIMLDSHSFYKPPADE